MDEPNATMPRQLVPAAGSFEQQRTGHVPKSATAALSNGTVVTTSQGSLLPAEHNLMRRRLVSDEVIGFEFERSRLLAHQPEGKPERPVSAQMPDLLALLGLADGTSHTFKTKPFEPDDEHGGQSSRALRDPSSRIPERRYGSSGLAVPKPTCRSSIAR
jgi:hypothetical protein